MAGEPDLSTSDDPSRALELRREPHRSFAAWHALRYAIAALLITSAILKTHALATSPTIPRDLFETRHAQLLTVELELFFAAWLLSGVAGHVARLATMAMLLVFAAVSSRRLAQGFQSCGCFGQITIHPGVALALDLGLLAVILFLRPNYRKQHRLHLALVLAYVFSSVASAFFVLSYAPRIIDGDGLVSVGKGLVLLEPEKWIGKRLPILPYIEGDSSQLQHGEWTLLFYHHDCPKCLEVLDRYQTAGIIEATRKIAFVEMPPYGVLQKALPKVQVFRLTDHLDWFMSTPHFIGISEATVISSEQEQSLLPQQETGQTHL